VSVVFNLAQLNIATMREPVGSPVMADFFASLDRINALADAAPGFVWRLEGDPPENPFGDMTLVNLSVWRSVEALSDYVHKSAHVEIMRRRREWFARLPEASMVLWWVPAGHVPTVREAANRLAVLRQAGPTPDAFTFATRFDPPVPTDSPMAFPIDGGCDCGAVRYRLNSAPMVVHCCHCRWCQRESGASFALNAMIESDRVSILGRSPELVDTPSRSGRGQKIARCPVCRVAVWSHYAGMGELTRFVRVGTLDNPDALPPDVHIFVASKQPWVPLPPAMPVFDEYYDRAAIWPPASLARFALLQATR
jgi:hypothetical protein